MDLSVYGALWRTRGVIALLGAAVVARLPVMAAAVPMAFLAKDAAGNFTWAGVVAGAYAIGTGVGGPLWARLADRRGGRFVLIATGTAWSIAVAVLALLPEGLFRLMPVVSALAGALVAPVGPTLRAAWPRLLDGTRLRAMYSLDASAQEIMFIAGPMLGAFLVSVASPRLGLLAFAGLAAVSIWWYGLIQPPVVEHDDASGQRTTTRQLLLHRHRLPLLVAFGLCVLSVAAVSIGVVAFADQRGDRMIAGVLEALVGVGGLIGGVVAGALPGKRRSYIWRTTVLAGLTYVLCVFATWSTVALAIAGFLAGVVLTPLTGAFFERMGALTPVAVRTEAYGWMTTSGMAGSAIGASLSGLAVEASGVGSAWILAAATTLLAAVLMVRIPPLEPVGT